MVHKPEYVKTYSYKRGDKFFFDTNIWINIECTNAQFLHQNDKKRDKYSWKWDAYSWTEKSILNAKGRIYTNIPVISEFINRYLKSKLDTWIGTMKKKKKLPKNADWKKIYRNEKAYTEDVGEIIAATKRVLDTCRTTDDNYVLDNPPNVSQLVEDLGQSKIDFTDLIIGEVCKREGLILVTDDIDFCNQEIPLITANPNFWGATSLGTSRGSAPTKARKI